MRPVTAGRLAVASGRRLVGQSAQRLKQVYRLTESSRFNERLESGPSGNALQSPERVRLRAIQDARPSHTPLSPLRFGYEAYGTRKPADRSASLLKGNLNSVCFSSHGYNDS